MNPYQFRYDGSPEAREIKRIFNEDNPDFTFFVDRYYNQDGTGRSSPHYDHDLLTPAQFVARMKGEQTSLPESRELLSDFIDWYNAHHPENYIPNSRLGNYLQDKLKLTLTDRIRHAYPSLSAEDVEQIVKMVRDDE